MAGAIRRRGRQGGTASNRFAVGDRTAGGRGVWKTAPRHPAEIRKGSRNPVSRRDGTAISIPAAVVSPVRCRGRKPRPRQKTAKSAAARKKQGDSLPAE